MSLALWPVFEDHHEHDLVDEGAVLLDAGEELDAIATAAGQTPLSAFDAYADVPEAVIAERAAAGDGIPDLSDLPPTWHDPSDAAATLDALVAAIDDRATVVESLVAFRSVLRAAAARGTRFHLTVA